MTARKRPVLNKRWRRAAECRNGYDPELWTCPEGDEKVARYICAALCPVRENCLRYALREKDPGVYGVMRGGIAFDGSTKYLCFRCQYPVADSSGVCVVCREYDPCYGECGRMVLKESDNYYCVDCKHKEEGITGE